MKLVASSVIALKDVLRGHEGNAQEGEEEPAEEESMSIDMAEVAEDEDRLDDAGESANCMLKIGI